MANNNNPTLVDGSPNGGTTTSGNRNHSGKTGKFISANGSSNVDNTKKQPSFLAKKGTTPSFLTNNSNSNKQNSLYNNIKRERWLKSGKLRTIDEIVDRIGDYIDEDVLALHEKWGQKSQSNMGAPNTSHSYGNKPLLNAIARKMFRPLRILDTADFDMKMKLAQSVDNSDVPYSPDWGWAKRGFHNKDIIKQYLGEEIISDVLLPYGVYGSCVYSAYDGSTEKGYASGRNGYVMSYIIDHKKANVTNAYDAARKTQEFKNRISEVHSNLEKRLKELGKDDTYINNFKRVFDNNVRDATFVPLLLGYDCVYETGSEYGLILNFGNIYTKKDW